MYCDQFLVRIDAYIADNMDDAERAEFRSHLATCQTCRDVAVSVEPTLLFAMVSPREPDPARVDSCVQTVMALIHQDQLAQKIRRRAPRWMIAAAAVLFLMIGVGALWMGSPVVIDAGSEIIAVVETPVPDADPPQIEVNMFGEGVRVYQFAQEEDAHTAVYFIVNSAMEL